MDAAAEFVRSVGAQPDRIVRGWADRSFLCRDEPVGAIRELLEAVLLSPAEFSASTERVALFRDRRLAVPLADLARHQLVLLDAAVREAPGLAPAVRTVDGCASRAALAGPAPRDAPVDRVGLARAFLRSFLERAPDERARARAADAALVALQRTWIERGGGGGAVEAALRAMHDDVARGRQP